MNIYNLDCFGKETDCFYKCAILEKGKPFKVCFPITGHKKYKGNLFPKETFEETFMPIPIALQPYFNYAKSTKDLIKEGKSRVVYIDENISKKIYNEHNIEDFCRKGQNYFDRIEKSQLTDEIYQQIAQEGCSNISFEVYIKYDSVAITYEGRQVNKTINFEDFDVLPLPNRNMMAALTNSILNRLSVVGIDGRGNPIDDNCEIYSKPSYFGKVYGAKKSGAFVDANKFGYKSHKCKVISFYNYDSLFDDKISGTYVYIYIKQTDQIIGTVKKKELKSW